MSIKGEKTFEEIVERLVALFKPQPDEATADADGPASCSESVERSPSPSTLTPSDEDTPN